MAGPTPDAIKLVAFVISAKLAEAGTYCSGAPTGMALLPCIFTVPPAVASPKILTKEAATTCPTKTAAPV